MSRAQLLAACRAQPPHSPEWYAAVTALGAASRAGFREAKKPGRPTGLTSGELVYRMTQSHVFDADRQAIRNRLPYEPHSQLIEWLKAELITRKQAERAATSDHA